MRDLARRLRAAQLRGNTAPTELGLLGEAATALERADNVLRDCRQTRGTRDEVALAHRIADALSNQAHRPTQCVWSEDEEGYWNTACGEVWIFNDGGPSDNRSNYCFYCGKHITEKPFVCEAVEDE